MSNITTVNCSDGVVWVYKYFGECVTTEEQYAGFIVGLISLILWLVPMIPQIYENYKRGSCDDSISIYFILFWIAGDSCNLLGAILSKQLPTQIYIGVYYIIQDAVLLAQYLYYKYTRIRRVRGVSYDAIPTSDDDPTHQPPVLPCAMIAGIVGAVCWYANPSAFALTCREEVDDDYRVVSFKSRKLMGHFFNSASDEVGYALGSLSAVCYFAGRLPQIYMNFARKNTEGLSLAMFIIIVFANLTYGVSVIMGGIGSNYILRHLPWLIGSLGCCFLDSIVLGQIFFYSVRRGTLHLTAIDHADSESDESTNSKDE